MNGTKKYEFTLDKSEMMEFCRVALWEELKQGKKRWITWAVICVLWLFIEPWIAVLIAAILALDLLVSAALTYKNVRKTTFNRQWTVWAERGILKVERGECSEMSGRNIKLIRTTPRLLMLGYMQTQRHPAWFLVPLRVFSDVQERQDFLDKLKEFPETDVMKGAAAAEGKEIAKDAADMEGAAVAENLATAAKSKEIFCFTDMMSPEKWVHMQMGAYGILNSGTLGKTGRLGKAVCYVCFLAASFMLVVCLIGTFHWIWLIYCILLALLMMGRVFFRNPEKYFNKEAKSPVTKDRVCGIWKTLLKEDGAYIEQPENVREFYPWESMGWLVETEDAFYLFHKNRKNYGIFFKTVFSDNSQKDAFCRFCTQKGLEMTPGKTMHYMPDWLFILLAALLVLSYAALVAGGIFWHIRG